MLDDIIIMDLKGNSLFSKCFENADKSVDEKEKDHNVVNEFITGKLYKLPKYEVNFRQFKKTKIAFNADEEKNLITMAISHNGVDIKTMQQQADLISKKFLEKYENLRDVTNTTPHQYDDFEQELVNLQIVAQPTTNEFSLKRTASTWKKLLYNPFSGI